MGYGLERKDDFEKRQTCGDKKCADKLKSITVRSRTSGKYILSFDYKPSPVTAAILGLR